jgi:hypothetical protein
MVMLPVEHAAGAEDEDWSADDRAEEELTLHETIRTLLLLHRE